eukprot:718974-Prymnesium_polylepis.2
MSQALLPVPKMDIGATIGYDAVSPVVHGAWTIWSRMVRDMRVGVRPRAGTLQSCTFRTRKTARIPMENAPPPSPLGISSCTEPISS